MRKYLPLLFILIGFNCRAQYAPTPNIGLQILQNGAINWNLPINYNFNRIDSLLSGNSAIPALSVSGNTTINGTANINSIVSNNAILAGVNNQFNTDLFINGSGNNGILNVQNSSNCVSGCIMTQPFGSTSTENFYSAINKSNSFLTSNTFGTKNEYFYNPGDNINPNAFKRTGSTKDCAWDDTFINLTNTPSGYCVYKVMSFSSPGFYDPGHGTLAFMENNYFKVTSRSISQMNGGYLYCQKVGDCNYSYDYVYYRGGTLWGSDEGVGGHNLNMFNLSPPSGTIITGGVNSTVIKSNFVVNGGNQGDAGNLISTSEIMDSGTITSLSSGSGLLLNSFSGTFNSHPSASSGYGTLATNCGMSTVPSMPLVSNCTLTIISGSFTSLNGTATVCVGDYTYPEQARVISVNPPSGGLQTISVSMQSFHVIGTPYYQNGGCGGKLVQGYGSATPMAPYNGTTSTGEFTTFFIAGSRNTTSYDYINLYKSGQDGNIPLPNNGTGYPNGIGPIPSISLTNLVSGGGTVTGVAGNLSFLNGWVPPSGTTIQISGSSNSTLNGNATNFTYNADTASFTYFLAGATGTAASATLNVVGMNNFQIACGAMTVSVINSTPTQPNLSGHPEGDGTLQTEANNCNWPVSGTIAQPSWYNQQVTLYSGAVKGDVPNNGDSQGYSSSLLGYNFSGAANFKSAHNEGINLYAQYGGLFIGHTGLDLEDYDAKGLNMLYAPIQDGCVICVINDPPTGGATQSYYMISSPHVQMSVHHGYGIEIYGDYSWSFNSILHQNGFAVIDSSSFNGPYTGVITLTSATSDHITINGITTSSKCYFSPTNTTAASISGTLNGYYTVSANTFTLSHAATIANGASYSVSCSIN